MNICALTIVIVSFLSLNTFSYEKIFQYEFDGSKTPDISIPAWDAPWKKFTESYSRNGLYKMLIPPGKGGRVWKIGPPFWDGMNTDSTVEFKVNVGDGDTTAGSARFCVGDGVRNWMIMLRNGPNKDSFRLRTVHADSDPVIAVPGDFFKLRICVKNHKADVYLNDNTEPVYVNWDGFVNTENDIVFGDGSSSETEWGTTVWDYIRWTNKGAFPPEKRLDAAFTLPQVIVPMTLAPPSIDGELNDACWEKAESVELAQWRGPAGKAENTIVKMCRDEKKIYFAFICSESEPELIGHNERPRDFLGKEDQVEIFLDTNHDRGSYFQIVLDSSNVIYDGRIRDPSWDGEIESDVHVGDRGWNAEIGVDLKSIDANKEHLLWGINFNRFQRRTKTLSSWAPLKVGNHEPQNFGLAIVGENVSTTDLKKRIQELRDKFENLKKNLALSECQDYYQESLRLFENMIENLTRETLGSEKTSPEKILYLEQDINLVDGKIESLGNMSDNVKAEKIKRLLVGQNPYVAIVENPINKVNGLYVPSLPVKRQVDIAACKGESESFQIVIFSGEKAMKTCRIQLSNLTSSDSVINGYKQNIWNVEYVQVKKPSKKNGLIAPGSLVADPLSPGNTFNVPANDIHSSWITIDVPRDVSPGLYLGSISISAPGFPQTTVPVKLRVWDFELPKTPFLKHCIGVWPNKSFDRIYNIDKNSTENKRINQACKSMVLDKYHITPRELPEFNPAQNLEKYEEWLENRMDRGATVIYLSGFRFSNDEKRKLQDFFQRKGLLDRTLVRPGDEPRPEDLPKIIENATPWKKYAPKIRVGLTTYLYKDLEGHIDTWIPLTPAYAVKRARELRGKGNEVWWYICNLPFRPYANFLTDSLGVEHRMLFWQTFEFGADGFFYWNSVNYRFGDPWSNIEGWPGSNGDGILVYPGPHGPLPSVRLEIIRDGLEDYDYLTMLKQYRDKAEKGKRFNELVGEADELLDISSFAGDMTRFSRDARDILERRRDIGGLLEKFKKAFETIKDVK